MSLDLTDLPPLSQPTPPSNTLLITNLDAPEIFTTVNLTSIQSAINDHAPIHTFSPLKSMRRIICTFFTTDDAIRIRQVLDGENVLGNRVRVYFGAQTKINVEDEERYLQAPKSQKLSPPNKEVHAEDLAIALARLHARPGPDDAVREEQARPDPPRISTRQRSGTGTVVYDPQDHGHSPHLPAIAVEDTTQSPDDLDPMEDVLEPGEKKFVHTARPPVELMQH
ncbi:Calcipressin [Teratosphaeria destructans]|uniref:Calcipressin n=1 Tax=Teratosphaeria destructans TaxID=418781 RepID=A0A9W7W2A5_9PEZI|nr:Calcipressin [Teratosphaeria destructans]